MSQEVTEEGPHPDPESTLIMTVINLIVIAAAVVVQGYVRRESSLP